MRGQAATEFLLILGFILLLILPAGYYVFTQTSESSRVLQADLAVSSLAKTADYIYYQAPGAKQLVDVYIPGGVEWANSYIGHPTALGGEEINLAVYTQTGGLTDVFADTQGEVRGSWPGNSGSFRFQVKKMSGGYVLISPYELGFLLNPTSYSTNLQPGQSTNFTLNATELEGYPKTVTLTPMGDISSWITLGNGTLGLNASSSNSTTVTVTAPSGTAFGQYTGYVEASDGNATESVYITVVVTGTGTGNGIEGGLFVHIIEPTNTTYYDFPINLTYWVNDSVDWCGYTLNGGDVVTISGNTTIATTSGPQYLHLMCVGDNGKSGTDDVWFTTDYGPEPWCFNASLLWAINGEYENETENARYSDDVYVEEPNVQKDNLAFIEGAFTFASPGLGSNIVVYNMTEWVEHHEGNGIDDITPILQWLTSNGWGKTVCTMSSSSLSDIIDVCTVDKINASSTIGQAKWIGTRVDYLSDSLTKSTAYIDWMAFEVCYGEAIRKLNILSPENTTYPTSSLWFNVSSNAVLESAWYSLDGGANQSMDAVNTTASKYVQGIGGGAHTVVFYANDTNDNWLSNSTSFTINKSCPYTVDMWELDSDKPQPLDFTSGLNTTANTFGAGAGDDGWDWSWDTYSSGSSCTYFNGYGYSSASSPTTTQVSSGVDADDNIRIEIGDVNDSCSDDGHGSGAFGVQFDVTQAMYDEIAAGGAAKLYFDWSFTNHDLDGGWFDNDYIWVKARFGNSGGMNYLGTNDGGSGDDSDNDILYQSSPSSTSGSEAIDVSSYITGPGTYYADFGGKVNDWDNKEWAEFRFDNINLNVSCAP